jgi:hypothetical protein
VRKGDWDDDAQTVGFGLHGGNIGPPLCVLQNTVVYASLKSALLVSAASRIFEEPN